MMNEKKTCCCCFTLKEGTAILLVLSLIGTIGNFLMYGINNNYPESVRLTYIIQSVVDFPFIIIGMIGVFGRKAACVSTYGFYLLVRLFVSIIIALGVLLPVAKSDAAGAVVLGLIIGASISIYIIYIFFSYSNELKKEKQEEKEIAAMADKV